MKKKLIWEGYILYDTIYRNVGKTSWKLLPFILLENLILYIFDGCKRHFVAVVLELKELLGFTACFHFGPFEMKVHAYKSILGYGNFPHDKQVKRTSFYGYENMQSEGMVNYFWIPSVFKYWLFPPLD